MPFIDFNIDAKEDRLSKVGLRDSGHLDQCCIKPKAIKAHSAARVSSCIRSQNQPRAICRV